MNRMIPITMSPGATTAACLLIVSGKAWLIIPPPAATSTRKNVPNSSDASRRHSCLGFWKSAIGSTTSTSNHRSNRPRAAARESCAIATPSAWSAGAQADVRSAPSLAPAVFTSQDAS